MNGASPDTKSPRSDSSAQYRRALEEVRHEYQAFLPMTQRVQANLRLDAADLRAQEGWDLATQRGIDAWIDDAATIFRFLKRNDFDEKKAYEKLLDALVVRVERALHQPIPAVPPYSSSELLHILPLPEHTDNLGRPIAVLCPREIKRNENGELEDLVEWTWWCCEMLRRTLADYWEAKKWGKAERGSGGEGCVVIVDAAGAGYRNLVRLASLSQDVSDKQEVELLPALTKVGSRNFPGMVQAVFIVNAGWTQRSLWSIVRKVVPKAAVERIKFAEKPAELSAYFDLAKLPHALGGTHDYTFTAGNPIFDHYTRHPVGAAPTLPRTGPPPMIPASVEEQSLTRAPSFASTAELFYTAQNSPSTSRASSHADLSFLQSRHKLGVNRYAPSPLATALPSPGTPEAEPVLGDDLASTPTAPEPSTRLPSLETSAHTVQTRWTSDSGDSHGPLARIKSLTDFKLYLSPSRLAQVELLDEPNDERVVPKRVPLMQRRRTLRPAMLDHPSCRSLTAGSGESSIAQRRSRPALHILGPAQRLAAGDMARSYSDRLMQHHAVVLHQLDELSPDALQKIEGGCQEGFAVSAGPVAAVEGSRPTDLSPSSAATPSRGPVDGTAPPLTSNEHATHLERISAFSRSLNPFYGYPALRSPTAPHKILPAHPRRKRDLVKTLLFLFILRLQSLRDAFERFFGLNRLLPWADLHSKWVKARNPEEGLLRGMDPKRGSVVKRTRESDWVWMGVGLLLLRGGWERLVSWPLEILGWEGVRALFGLA